MLSRVLPREGNPSSIAPSFLTSFRTESSRFGIIPSDLISPACSATATAIVSAWTSNPTNFILFIDRLLSLVALYCRSSDSQHNPRLRIGAGHSMVTKPLFDALKQLKRAQQTLSRGKKGSKNRIKARIRVAKILQKVRDVRTDWLQKLSTRFVQENQLIAVETLAVRNMIRNHCLACRIADAG